MPRSAKDSEEEVDVKTTGRKTRLTDVGSTDTSLRRSTRIKSVKQNDSSPESNDNSNVSNTQTRITRKRTGTMDNTTAIEKQRVLRSRRNSVSSDVSETPEIDATAIGTPTKRNRNSIGNDMLSRTGSQRIKRLTRAGSESKSSPARVTRNTRATSMEPETDAKNRLIQKDEHDLTHTPVRTRRRTLIMSSEATVIEEKEEPLKVLMVTLDRTLPEVNETEETDLNDSTKLVQKSDSVSNKENTPDKKHYNINEEDDEDNISENPPQKSVESVEKDRSTNDNNMIPDNDKHVLEETENLLTSTVTETNLSQSFSQKIADDNKDVSEENKIFTSPVTEMDLSIHNSPQSVSQNADQNTSKELGLKIENLLSNSIEKHEDFSNKENLAANVISDEPDNENTGTNISVQSPKPLSVSNSNKVIKDKCKSPSNVLSRSRHSKSSESMDDSVIKELDGDVANKSVVENLNASTNADTDNSDMPKLAIESDSLSGTTFNTSPDRNISVKISSDSSSCDSIELMRCTDDVKSPDNSDRFTEINEETTEVYVEESNEIEMDTPSSVEKLTNANEDSGKDTVKQETNIIDKDNVMEDDVKEEVKPCMPENVQSDDKVNHKNTSISLISPNKTLITNSEFSIESENKDTSEFENINAANTASSNINTVLQSANDRINPEDSISTNTDEDGVTNTVESSLPSTESENKDTSEFENINAANTASSNINTVLQSSNDRINPEDSISTNTDEDGVTNTVKSSLPSTVAETPIEVTEEKPEKEDLSVNDILTLKEQPVEKSVEQKSESIQETCAKNEGSMNVDDNDSDKNAENLFQDIPANEWKEKNVDSDKNSIHSMSAEKLEHETEAECDLVLVDKEAWLAAENMKAEKEAEASDYNSDDTIVLKMQGDSLKEQNNVQMEIDTSADSNKMNVSKETAKNESNVDSKKVTKNTKNSKSETQNTDFKNANQNKSITEEQNEHSTSKHNVSNRKSTGERNLNVSRKSIDTAKELSLDKSNLSDNVFVPTEEEKETADAELDSEGDVMTSAKKSKRKQSLNISAKKQVNRSEESDNDCKDSSLSEKRTSTKKKKLGKKRSPARNVMSDSDSENNSNDSQNATIELPKFLLDEASNTDSNDNESDKSIDSDIKNEYNLDGKDTCKFSDDDVPGDECRASETESSDPDDNGSDLADFVVYDDVEEEEEEEEEEEVGDGGEESENEETNNIEKKIKGNIIEKETDSENEEKNDDADMSIDTSVKRKSKSRTSDGLNASDVTKSDSKKQKSKKRDTSQAEKSEKEQSLSDTSLSHSLKMKKSKQKRSVNEFIVEDIEQPLNDSYSVFNKKTQKLSRYSTPKSHHLPTAVEYDVDVTLNTSDSKINTSADKRKVEDTMSKTENSFTKLSKQKSKRNSASKDLSSELAELVENVDFSKPLPSKIADLNKTYSALDSETPTTKYLKKDKLNDSAPVLKLDSKLTKIKSPEDYEPSKTSNHLEEEPDDVNTQKIDTSLKQKLLKVAGNILEVDQQKKQKKRKHKIENNNPDKLIADDFLETTAPQVLIQTENIVSSINNDKNEEIEQVVLNKAEKKKKKKQKLTSTDIKEQVNENIETESTKKLVPKKIKKKQEKEIVENVPDTYSEKQISGKKKKKASHVMLTEEITTTQISKKKQKLPSNDTSDEKLPKRKKQLVEDVTLQHEVPSKKRKKNLSPDDLSDSENIPVKKVSKKKHKLLVEDEKKKKAKLAKATDSSQQSNDVASLSDDGPTIVTFSEARTEALNMIKRITDSVKGNKEMKKKKRKENIEEMQRGDEFKNEKQVRNREIKAKQTGTQKTGIKRLPDELLENLSDIPLKSLKKRKISRREEQTLPSRTMSSSEDKKVKNTYVDDFVPLSSCGATTKFAVASIQKIKKKKKNPKIASFKQKMFARNSRQPVSAYLMYLEKQKASGNDNFSNKPY